MPDPTSPTQSQPQTDVVQKEPVNLSSNKKEKKDGKVILLIEDDPVLCRMYTEKFKTEGFKVVIAMDGESGLEAALKNEVDLILLDIMLPRISGIDLLTRLRKDPAGKDVKVLALTNLADQAEKEKALNLGVKDYLVKAMQTPEQVIEKIKSYLVA